MDCLVLFLVIRHGKEEKKKEYVKVSHAKGREEGSSNCKKGPNACRKMGVFLRLLKWKYLSLGEVISPLMVGHDTPLTQYTSI